MKKAMVERLKGVYHMQWFEESGASYPLRVFLKKDTVTVGLDTTGVSLHKRGYRPAVGEGSDCRESGGCADYADSMEEGPDTGGSFLRERYISHRGGNDGGKYCAGDEPELYGGELDESDGQEAVVQRC